MSGNHMKSNFSRRAMLDKMCVGFGGLAFNLVPLCVEGVKSSQLIKIGLIIFIILVIVAIIAIGSGYLYSYYLQSTR